MDEGQKSAGLNREQKTGFVLLLVFGVLAVGLGALQMRNTIYSPFVIRAADDSGDSAELLDETTRLRQIDTDHDSLSDYDELNVYITSPYIPDTDSDGVLDKVEIDRGTDPLCPEGKTCNAGEEAPSSSSTQFLNLLQGSAGGTNTLLNVVDANTTLTAADIAALSNDPDALRELLRRTGRIPEETLSKVDNAALIQIANDLVKELSASSSPQNP